jgi:hypothetical protein
MGLFEKTEETLGSGYWSIPERIKVGLGRK